MSQKVAATSEPSPTLVPTPSGRCSSSSRCCQRCGIEHQFYQLVSSTCFWYFCGGEFKQSILPDQEFFLSKKTLLLWNPGSNVKIWKWLKDWTLFFAHQSETLLPLLSACSVLRLRKHCFLSRVNEKKKKPWTKAVKSVLLHCGWSLTAARCIWTDGFVSSARESPVSQHRCE